MFLHDLLASLPALELPASNPEISSLVYDSRQVRAGSLYIAQPGLHFDGHDFIPAAISAGAAAVIYQSGAYTAATVSPIENSPPLIAVANTRQALAALSAQFYHQPAQSLQMIGVTGTNGKTTISYLISQLLDRLQSACGWIGTLGAGLGQTRYPGQYTTPFPPELHQRLQTMAEAGAQNVVMECSSHALDQSRLDAIPFEVAIFSNLTQDHLDYHADMQAYAEAKAILFQRLLKSTGQAIIQSDDPYADFFAQQSRAPVLRYGCGPKADWQASEIKLSAEGTRFHLKTPALSQVINSPLSGQFNVLNLMAALCAVQALGFELKTILAQVPFLKGVPGRLERVSPDQHPFSVYVDYAHTPDSLKNVLESARVFTSGRLIVLFGCGGDRDRGKRPLMAQIAQQLADCVIISSDNPRTEDPAAIIQDILQGIVTPSATQTQINTQIDRKAAIVQAIALAEAGDVLVIAGKGHENYQIIGTQKFDFDDRQIAQELL